jgi:acyl-CoA dehydrogenase
MWGNVGGNEAVLQFDDVCVAAHQLVGDLHDGFRIAMHGVNLGRIFNTARAVGIGRHALETTVDHISLRKAFGKTLSEYQGITFPLADAATEIHAAHLMGINVAQLLDRGNTARKELAMTKGFAVRAASKAVDLAIQAHGAMGMTNEMHLTDAYITVRQAQIADGTNEILKRAIVKELLGGDLNL